MVAKTHEYMNSKNHELFGFPFFTSTALFIEIISPRVNNDDVKVVGKDQNMALGYIFTWNRRSLDSTEEHCFSFLHP